jgi:exonuclease III
MNLQHTQNRNWSILNWNVRGLNDEAKQRAVRAKTEESACTVFCIQETKMTPFDSSILKKDSGSLHIPPLLGPLEGF